MTEGGGASGLGHVNRCLSLYQVLERHGAEVEFVVHGDKTVKKILAGARCRLSDWRTSFSGAAARLKGADVVIVDSYLAGRPVYSEASKGRLLLSVDDFKRLRYPEGILLNNNLYAASAYTGKKYSGCRLLGPRFALLRRPFWTVPGRKISKVVSKVLLVAGGNDAANLAPFLVSVLREKFGSLKTTLVVGRGARNVAELRALAYPNLELLYGPDAEEMKRRMLDADVAVSACGQTLYELARTGLPAVGVVVADNQLGNAKAWKRAGTIKYAGFWGRDGKELIKTRVVGALEDMRSPAVRAAMSRAGRRLVDGRGPDRIYSEIKKRVRQGRPCGAER